MKSYINESAENVKRRSPHGERGLKSYINESAENVKRRSPHGERGLKYLDHALPSLHAGRSPHGERGLKSQTLRPNNLLADLSLPTRGAWIEMWIRKCWMPERSRRSPHGERGLKWRDRQGQQLYGGGRSPHGERGLKSLRRFRSAGTFGRSPHGERGLKSCSALWLSVSKPVAPHTGSVD